jgi:hypothetical protein
MIFSFMAGQCSSLFTASTSCIENLATLTHLTIDLVEGEVISKEPSSALSIDVVGGESCLMFDDEWMSSSSSLCAQRWDTVPSGLSPCKGSAYSREALVMTRTNPHHRHQWIHHQHIQCVLLPPSVSLLPIIGKALRLERCKVNPFLQGGVAEPPRGCRCTARRSSRARRVPRRDRTPGSCFLALVT